VTDSFKELEATSLFCNRCRRATPVRKKLLLVLPSGHKYDYACTVCGASVGGKTDNDATDFHAMAPRPGPRANPPRLR
jgi:polyferredoxin